MPAGASSGVFDVTAGSGMEEAIVECSAGVAEGVAEDSASGGDVLGLPHDHGAYHDP
jgi:hypothetical protein